MINNVFENYSLYTALEEISNTPLVNDTRGSNNCYLCFAAALLTTSVTTMMRTAGIPPLPDAPMNIDDIKALYDRIAAAHNRQLHRIGPLASDYRNPHGNFWFHVRGIANTNKAFAIAFNRSAGPGHVITGMRHAITNVITFYDAQTRQRIPDPANYLDGEMVTSLYIFQFSQ